MPYVTVAYNPSLTPEKAAEIFRKHFKVRYEIHMVRGRNRRHRQFGVRKSGFMGVFVGLEQDGDRTCFTFNGNPQSAMAIILVRLTFGTLSSLILRPLYTEMEAEIKSFIENELEFIAPPHLPRKKIVKKRLKSPHQRP